MPGVLDSIIGGAGAGSVGGPWGAAIGGGLGLISGLLGGSGEKDQAEEAYRRARPAMIQQGYRNAARGSIFGGLAKAYGIDSLMPQGALENLSTPVEVPLEANTEGSTKKMLGGILGQASAGIGQASQGSRSRQVLEQILMDIAKQSSYKDPWASEPGL